MSQQSTMLHVQDVSKFFPAGQSWLPLQNDFIRAVQGVSFRVNSGQTLGLVGESGCGKSTLARSIMRMHDLTEGKVIVDGTDVFSLGRNELRNFRRNMQMVFQDPYSSLNPRLSIKESLNEPFVIHSAASDLPDYGNSADERASQLLKLVGLDPELRNRYPHEFSGGQRQRIAIARAVALRPKLLVLDEPVSALDVSVQAQILNLLADLREKLELTYIFIAHDLAVVEHFSEFVGVMYLGKLVELAPTDQLFENPQHPYSKALLASSPGSRRPSAERESLAVTDLPSPRNIPQGCAFHPRCPLATDLCRQHSPELKEKNGRSVSCHNVGSA